MPSMYKGQLGFPFHWSHEISGELRHAVEAYHDNRIENKTVTDAQIALLRDYLSHYINAPCWDNPEFQSELAHLRWSVSKLDSATEISKWIHKSMEIGLDPL
jgi:hypothetical protein